MLPHIFSLKNAGRRISKLVSQATDRMAHKDYAGAFALLAKAKSYRQPIRNVDLMRAECFIKMERAEEARQALLEELTYFPDNEEASRMLGLLPVQNWRSENAEFNNLLKDILPFTMLGSERLYSLFSLGKTVCEKDIDGNFVECGVARGGSSALLAYVIRNYSKRPRLLFSFDTFDGMPNPTPEDTHEGRNADSFGWGSGTCSGHEKSLFKICKKLNSDGPVRAVKGRFQDTLPAARTLIGAVSLLHMDGDWYESTKAVLDNLYDSIVQNGIVQIDDYGYWDGCSRAVHEFEEKKHIQFKLNRIDKTGVWFEKVAL